MNPAPVLVTNLFDDDELFEGEIHNIVIVSAICVLGVGWPMRRADLAICRSMMDHDARGQRAVESLLEATCEYLWDHICGEPDDFTPEDLAAAVTPALNAWYAATTAEERARVE